MQRAWTVFFAVLFCVFFTAVPVLLADQGSHPDLEAKIEHSRELIKLHERTVDNQIFTVKEEIKLARENLNMRLVAMNEIREQLREQSLLFARKDEVAGQISKLEQKMDMLLKLGTYREGSAAWSDHLLTVAIAAGITLIMQIYNRRNGPKARGR